jgi:hypothetical protein
VASSRITGTNENVSTYGGSGLGRDYTTLATWEADTDNNLVFLTQSEVLECYADEDFDDYVELAGATTNGSYFRIVRPASGEGHDGTPNTGVTFASTTDTYGFYVNEAYSSVQDLIVALDINSSTTRVSISCSGSAYASFIGILAIGGTNSGSGGVNGIQWGQTPNPQYVINCIAAGLDGDGFIGSGASNTPYVYNCLSIDNTGYGFTTVACNNSYFKNCISTGNGTTNQFTAQTYGTCHTTTCYVSQTSPQFRDASVSDYHISDLDLVRPPGVALYGKGTDLSADANFAFDDDIDGDPRVEWSIGPDDWTATYGTFGVGSATPGNVVPGDYTVGILLIAYNLLDGKISIKNLSTDLLDGKARVKDVATDNLDGKVGVGGGDTDNLDGKLTIQNALTALLDGKLQVGNANTESFDGKLLIVISPEDNLDGKLTILDKATDLLDGKLQIGNVAIDSFDGKIQVGNILTDNFDAKLIVLDKATNFLDGKLNIGDATVALLDGKLNIKDVATDSMDGKLIVATADTDNLDGKLKVLDYSTEQVDGKLVITATAGAGTDTDLGDLKITIKDKTTESLDGKLLIVGWEAVRGASGSWKGQEKASDEWKKQNTASDSWKKQNDQ